jgi:hypothetical protein
MGLDKLIELDLVVKLYDYSVRDFENELLEKLSFRIDCESTAVVEVGVFVFTGDGTGKFQVNFLNESESVENIINFFRNYSESLVERRLRKNFEYIEDPCQEEIIRKIIEKLNGVYDHLKRSAVSGSRS